MKQTIRESKSAVFQCSIRGNPRPTVTWLGADGTPLRSRFRLDHSGRLEISHVTLGDAGKYTCVGRNVLGTANQSAVLVVEAPPRVQLAPGPTYAKTGQNVMLPKCHVTGFPVPVVTWRKIPGSIHRDRTVQDGGLLTVGVVGKHDTGLYLCHAKNSLEEASAGTSLVILPVLKFSLKPPQAVIKAPGDDLSLTCSASGEPAPAVSWKRFNGAWEEKRMKVNRGSLTISALKEADFGIYICEAKVPFYTIETRTEVIVKAAECTSYSSLTSGDRKTTYRGLGHCDKTVLNGWYRFQGAAGTKMPTTCPPTGRCYASAPGWLNGANPIVAEGQVTKQVCFHYSSICCKWSTNIQVRNCGSYYVYHFSGTPGCSLRYCSTD